MTRARRPLVFCTSQPADAGGVLKPVPCVGSPLLTAVTLLLLLFSEMGLAANTFGSFELLYTGLTTYYRGGHNPAKLCIQ